MGHGRKRQLSDKHWQNIADPKSSINDQDLADAEFRRTILKNIIPILEEIIGEALTRRQREVWELYLASDDNTQQRVAEILGIRQPTVSQHLNGRIRKGAKIGGAVKRIRKRIKHRLNTPEPPTRAMSALAVFDKLLRESQTRRSAHSALESIHS